MKNFFKGSATVLLVLSFYFVKAQQTITYTPMTAAGYQFKYGKFDSGLNVPNIDTSTGRGTVRAGSLVMHPTTKVFYGWDGTRWNAFGNTTASGIFVDSITVAGNNVCQWVQGVPTCYTISGGGTFTGVDSLTYTGNSLCWWKAGTPNCYAMVPGVDSVTLAGNQFCQWVGGVSTCYTIDGNVLGTGIDSITVVGTQLCQWISGASTCYTINTTNTGIDSITIINNNFCIYINGVPSCITLTEDTVYVEDDLTVRIDSLGHQVIGRLHDDGRVWGGVVTGGTNCMDIDITPTSYYLGGTAFLSAQTTLTISAADPTLNRYDLIVVDSSGLVAVIIGTGAANPVIPQHNPGAQVPLTSIYVPAGATCLPISKGMIYNENIEYTTASTGTVTVDFNNTANPHALTKAAFVSAYDYGSTLTFTKPSGVDTIRAGAILKFWIYLNKPFTGSLQVQFFNGTTPVSSRQTVAAKDGFLSLDTSQYRNVSMTLGNWQTPPTIWNKLVIYPSGSDLSGAGGFYLDEIQVQTGLTPQGKAYVDSVYRIGDSLYYTKSGIQTFISAVSASTFDTTTLVDYTFTGLRDHDGLKYDSANDRWVNFRRIFNEPLSYNYNSNTLSVDTSTALTGLTTLYQNSLKQDALTLTTTGSSGAATLVGSTLNIPEYGGGGGGGTVTSVSDLAPLFTTTNPTTTPTFVLSNAGANTIFGNITGSSAAPTFFANPFWNLTGNTGTTGTSVVSTNFLGTTDSKWLWFKTKNSGAIVIDTFQNVGVSWIPVTGGEKLRVNGNGRFGTGTGTATFNTSGLVINYAARTSVELYNNASTAIDAYWMADNANGDATGSIFATHSNHDITIRTNTLSRARWRNSGEFGIRNLFPTAKLHLGYNDLLASSAPLKFTYLNFATTAATGNGSVATLSFATQGAAPFIIGSTIIVSGVTPAGYNGTHLVSASTTTSVSYNSATTGAQTVAGTVTAGTSLMTTPENGAVEYDGTNFFATNSTATRFTLAKTLTATATLDFPNTNSGIAADLTITVTGAAVGDAVSIGVPAGSVTATAMFTAWVSSTNTVTIRFIPHATEDPASGTFRASVIRY